MNIVDKLRASHVTRWHIVATTREQTLADHQWCVTQIAYEIWKRLHPGAPCPANLLLIALNHDNDEVIEGDIPSPRKPSQPVSDMEVDRLIVKSADLLDQWNWIRQWGKGRHAMEVMRYCTDCLDNFLEECPNNTLRNIVRGIQQEMIHGEYEV